MTCTASHVTAPGKMAAMVQIVEITLVGIGLTFKRDIAVGIAAHGQPDHPLEDISDIEEHVKHLALLGGVDALVVHHLVAQIDPVVDKKYPQQIDC